MITNRDPNIADPSHEGKLVAALQDAVDSTKSAQPETNASELIKMLSRVNVRQSAKARWFYKGKWRDAEEMTKLFPSNEITIHDQHGHPFYGRRS